MKHREKIDLLVMRGAGRVMRYRLSPGWLHAMWIIPLLLVIAIGLTCGLVARQQAANRRLQSRVTAMETEHDAVGERLLRLENIENILRSQDVGALDAFLAAASPDNPDWWRGKTSEHKDAAKDASKDKSPAPRTDLSRLFARVDTNAAGVDNLRSAIENRRLVLGFDLSNLSPQSPLVGRGDVALIGNDATLSPLKDEKNDLAFQIQRFKQIATSFALPAKCDPKDVYGIRLTMVDPAGKTIFSQVFPLTQK